MIQMVSVKVLYFATLAIMFATSLGCGSGRPTAWEEAPTVSEGVTAAAIAELQNRVQDEGSVKFRSWGGKWIGTDCDTEITFQRDQRVHMTDYGQARSTYSGTYRVDSQGKVTTMFSNLQHQWPTMLLRKDSKSLVLYPAGKARLMMRNLEGTNILESNGAYWPFRAVFANEEFEWKGKGDCATKRKGDADLFLDGSGSSG